MKFVNLDESEIIEQPLEKVIVRPDYSPIEFGYDDLCSLDSVSVDGIHPSGDDSDLILPPSINKINNCFKSEYFKISNLFSEIQTYEQKQEALKNLGLLGAISNSTYIHDLGKFDKQVDAEEAAVNVANNSNVVIMLYHIGSQNGIIFQQVGDTITKQVLFLDNTIFQRHINFSDSSKTQVSSISYWWKLGATHISYDPDTRKFHLQDMNYKNLNPTVDSEVPLASSTLDGFMSKELVKKLESFLSTLSTKLDALSPGDGITMMNNTVSTLIGNGLTYNGREIVINHDLTLKTNDGKLGVNTGDGLYVNPDNELGVNVGRGLAINHTDSTVEVAEEVLNDIDTLELKVKELDIELDSKIESEPVNTSITNIEESLVSSALRKTPLTLTESEKEQARTNIEALKELTLTVKDNGNIVISNIQGETKEFMPATPSGDPMHYAYVNAGAEYNDTTNFIVKDTPWKDLVDTIEDKAKWGFDIVDVSQVKLITIGGTTYNYVQTTRQSPEGTTEPRYFLVGQASDGTWVEDETKVLHLPGHWYLNGLGDITGTEIALCYTQTMPWYATTVLTKAFRVQENSDMRTLKYRTTFRSIRQFATIASTIECESMCFNNKHIEIFILTFMKSKLNVNINGLSNAFQNATHMKYLIGQLVSITNITFPQNIRVLSLVIKYPANFSVSSYISKPSILYVINNAAPTTPITITLHADRYAQLSEDVDIVAALEAKNTALAGTGGSISLVSA